MQESFYCKSAGESGLQPGQVKTGNVLVHNEEKKGCALFDQLMTGYDYRIVEVSVPEGYNKLEKPVEISLPYETQRKIWQEKQNHFMKWEAKNIMRK